MKHVFRRRALFSSSGRTDLKSVLRRRPPPRCCEPLEPRQLLSAAPVISEFMASNDSTLADSTGAFRDWIEIFNAGDEPLDLAGWHLTDNPNNLAKWTFPSVNLPAGEFLIVFASGCNVPGIDCPEPSVELHTNFELNREGEYVALVQPDGATVVSSFGPAGMDYPRQFEDVSYGLGQAATLIGAGAAASALVPASDALGQTWTEAGFAPDGSWSSGPTGVGYAPGGGAAVLALDFNARNSGDGAVDTQSGFTGMTLNQNGGTFNGITVTLTAFGGATLDDRDRAVPTNSGGLTTAQIYDDFIFANGTFDGAEMQVRLQGLTPTTPYRVTLWSYDNGSTTARVSDWTEIASGTPVEIEEGYTFDGAAIPTSDGDDTMTADLVSSPTGELILRGVRNGGNSHGVFLNALKVEVAGIGGLVATNIGPQMAAVNASAYVRVPFEVPAGAAYDTLTLRIKYDAGFVAYLNGVEVARRNAPTAAGVPPAFNAAATAERSIAETTIYETIDLSAHRNLLVDGGANVLALHGLNSAAGDEDFVVLPELIGTNLGGGGAGQYFETATPGGPNGEGVFGFVEDTAFSHDRGFYDAPLDVTISTPTVGASIYYTLDGSEPTPTNPAAVLYGGPVHINTTTTLRAAGYKADFRPTDVDTQTYIFLDHVVRQGEIGVNYVEISNANTVGTLSGAADWAFPTVNGTSSTQWVPRVATSGTPFGTFTTAWESAAAVDASGVPMITVAISGLAPGEAYNVFANFWDGDGTNVWNVRAGLSPDNLTLFTSGNSYFTGQVSGNRILYNGLVGQAVADAGGVIRVYIDDAPPNNGATRTFLDSVGYSQGEVPTLVPREYPSVWQGSASADFVMDPEVVAQWDDFNPANTDIGIRTALLSIPTMSIVMDPADLWGPPSGIYPNATATGTAWRRPGSIEYYDPATGAEFQYNAGVQMHGGASRDNVRLKKHSFRLVFNDQFDGPNSLRFPLFGDAGTDDINTVVLRAHFTDAFATRTQTGRYSPLDSMYMRDVWMRETQIAMGHQSAHNTYVHLYINGLYWGLYNAAERPDDAFQEAYYGGQREDYDIIKDFNELFRGNRTAWDQMFALARQLPGSDPDAIYQRLQGNNPDGTPNAAFPVLLDMDNLIDYMLLHLYAGAEDWPHHNWYAARSRTADSTGFKFFVWDQEIVLDGRYRDRTEAADANSPAELFNRLRSSPAFRSHVADHVQKHMFNGGALSTEANQARWMQWADRIEAAIIAESARWGDAREGELITVDSGQPSVVVPTMTVNHWRAERDNVRDNYFPQSHTLTISRFVADGLYPSVAAPVYSQHGGSVPAGYELTMTDPAPLAGNTIYYTTDGSDPRVATTTTTATTLVAEAAAKRVLVPTLANGGNLLGDAWKGAAATEPFDDGGWIAGTGGLGYDEATTYVPYISPSLDLGTAMNDVNTSVFVRVPFTVDAADLATFEFMSLNVRYDDGFVAYLNGQEIARANAPAGTPAWNATASGAHPDGEAVGFVTFNTSAFLSALQPGANVLALHGLNAAITSTDFLLSAELVAGELPEVAISPTAQPYTGPVVLDESATVRARIFSAGEWSALSDAFFTVESPLRVSEIHYNPAARTQAEIDAGILDRDDFEFIELVNTSSTATINLAGVRFSDGIEFTFGDIDLAPQERIVVVQNMSAFEFRYGTGVNVAGQYGGTPENYRLANAGEQITLLDAGGGVIQSFAYDDAWYPATDGDGYSLTLIDESAPLDTWNGPANWRSSFAIGGSPGTSDRLPGDFNGDLRVDLVDLAILQSFFGTASDATLAQGDANGDGAVDRADVVLFVQNFGRSPAPPSPSAASAIVSSTHSTIRDDASDAARTVLATARRRRALDRASIDAVVTQDALRASAATPDGEPVRSKLRARRR